MGYYPGYYITFFSFRKAFWQKNGAAGVAAPECFSQVKDLVQMLIRE